MKLKKIADTILATIDVVDVEPKDYDKKDNTFSFEMSDKDLDSAPHYINLRNSKTKNILEFERFKVDYADSTHEDIAGYWYQTKDKEYKLLLIND